MVSFPSKRFRSIASYAGLLAVLFLYVPQGMLAWWAGTGGCCKSDYCPIHEHHGPLGQTQRAANAEMDCEHGAPALAGCSLSCCRDTQQALVGPVVFLVTASFRLEEPAGLSRVSEASAERDKAPSTIPPAPPPRFLVAAS